MRTDAPLPRRDPASLAVAAVPQSAPLSPPISQPLGSTPGVTRCPAPSPACDACRHDLDGHDAIGRRFCSATVAGALTRGCICR